MSETDETPSTPLSKWAWPLTWALAVLPFLGYWTYGLFDLDEGFYGAVVTEMNRRGEWITPYYNGHPWFEKPILLYWLAKPLFAAFGLVFGPRLVSVLASLTLFAWVTQFVRRRFNDAAAQRTLLILASSALVVGAGRMLLVDPLLNLCFTGAMLTLWNSFCGGGPRARQRSGAMLGLSVLAKGPVGVILYGLTAGITYWREPALRLKFRGGWLGFSLLFALGVAVWYLPAYLVDGHLFVQKFLVEQNLQRFTGGDAAHSIGLAGLPFYVPVLFLTMLPWTLYLFRAWPRGRAEDEEAQLRRYLATWILVVVGFFTLSGTKLPHYVLPACVPIAILVGEWLARRSSQTEAIAPSRLPGYVAAVAIVWIVIQGGSTWYYGLFHAEVHLVTRFVKEQGGDVAVYQMPRRTKGLGTLKPEIQETSHPSIVMYLDKPVLEAETVDQLIAAPKPLWVITRVGRITDADIRQAAMQDQWLHPVPVEGAERHYVLYRMEDKPSSRSRRHSKALPPRRPAGPK